MNSLPVCRRGMRDAGCCRILILLVSLGVPAAAVAQDSPYLLAKKDFRKAVAKVAMAPLQTPGWLTLPQEQITAIEQLAQEEMEDTRFKLIPVQTYRNIRLRMSEQVGGLLNAAGEVDPRRRHVVWDHAQREMRLRHDMEAFAHISIVVVNALFSDDKAEWDGVSQKVKKSGDGFTLFGGKNYQGVIAAASFQLAIYDRADELLFVNRAGIEVLQERKKDALVPLPAEQLLRDDKRIKKAVQRAFKRL